METRLERRPEARAFSVETLLQLVREGKIRVPDFQRPLRWRAKHVLDLFDSVYRGFPVGDLLFFKRAAPAARLHVGPVTVDAPAVADAHFVVDGQQRITALAAAMLHPEAQPRGDIYAVWFDLEAERFALGRGAVQPASFIPLNVVSDSIALLTWLHEWPFRSQRPDLVQRAIALGKALREYQIPAYIVEGASDEALRLIFKRVNTSGVAMNEGEVFGALYRGNEAQPHENACTRLQTTTGFGRIRAHGFMQCLKVVEGLDVRRTLTEAQLERLDAQAVDRVESALLRAIRFLVEDAGVFHSTLLPSPLPLVVLAKFFHLYPRPSERTRQLLARWLWRNALSFSTFDIQDDIQRTSHLVGIDEFTTVERLLASVEETPLSVVSDAEHPYPWATLEWQDAHGVGALVVLALSHLGPRDPETGDVIGVEELGALLEDSPAGEVFLDVDGDVSSIVARRVLVTSRRKIRELATASLPILESHGIDQEAADALGRGDVATFAARRAAILDRWFQTFFTDRMGLDDSDRPPIDELIRRADKVLAAE